MNQVKIRRPTTVQPHSDHATSSPSGSFESTARLDVHAAMIRNQTWILGPAWKTWDNQYAAAPQDYPIFNLPALEENNSPPEGT